MVDLDDFAVVSLAVDHEGVLFTLEVERLLVVGTLVLDFEAFVWGINFERVFAAGGDGGGDVSADLGVVQ